MTHESRVECTRRPQLTQLFDLCVLLILCSILNPHFISTSDMLRRQNSIKKNIRNQNYIKAVNLELLQQSFILIYKKFSQKIKFPPKSAL